MSVKRQTKNYLKSNDSSGTSRLSLKPIIVSDSKGRYLKEYVDSHKNPESSILWAYKGGATTFNRYLWLKQNIDSLITKYGNLSIYIFTGSCDLTIKQVISDKRPGKKCFRTVRSKFIVLRGIESLSLLKRHYILIRRLLESKGVKVTFLHLPLYSIQHWNRT